MKQFILLLALIFSAGAPAQNDTLLAVYGSVVDVLTDEPVRNAQITAHAVADTSDKIHSMTDGNGRFMLGLFAQMDRIFVFDAEGYAPRRVQIDMEGPDEAGWARGYGLSLQMSLYREVPGVDLTMDDIPIGKSIYNREMDVFEWDRDHSRSLSARNKAMLKVYKQQVKN